MTSRGTLLSLDELRDEGDALMRELSREQYLVGAGHKAEADLRSIYLRHEAIAGEESLHLAKESYLVAREGTEDRRSARMLLEWQAELAGSRAVAELDEQVLAWEAAAVVSFEGGAIEYEGSLPEIANSADRGRRLAIDRARNDLIQKELVPLRQARFRRERDVTEALDLAVGFIPTIELLSGISLRALAAQSEQLLRDTAVMYDDVRREFVRQQLGLDPAEVERSDAQALLRVPRFDGAFPAHEMRDRVLRQASDMGLDPTAGGRITLDTDDRPGKKSRAFCAPVRIPEEVYLVVRPRGGQADWMSFLHELGHSLHYAYTRAGLGFEFRWLGDNSITESYAMLFHHRLSDAGWLARYTDLRGARLTEFLRVRAFDELHLLRRYCAKFLHEMELYSSEDWDDMPARYAERLTCATGFRYDAANAFVDLDPRFYSARYLRAWQLQGIIGESLVNRFDADWWRNPRAGPWLAGSLFSEGQHDSGDELAARVAGTSLGFAPLVREAEASLA